MRELQGTKKTTTTQIVESSHPMGRNQREWHVTRIRCWEPTVRASTQVLSPNPIDLLRDEETEIVSIPKTQLDTPTSPSFLKPKETVRGDVRTKKKGNKNQSESMAKVARKRLHLLFMILMWTIKLRMYLRAPKL